MARLKPLYIATAYKPHIHHFNVSTALDSLSDVQQEMLAEPATFLLVDSADNPAPAGVGHALDAVTTTYKRLPQTMLALRRAMNRAMTMRGLEIGEPIVGKPRRSGLYAYVTAQFPISDGQTVSVVFHAPDDDPGKVGMNDTLIAFIWRLNSADITGIVAPDRENNGMTRDISLNVVADRVADAVSANSDKFKSRQAAIARHREDLDQYTSLVEQAQTRLNEIEGEIATASSELQQSTTRLDLMTGRVTDRRQRRDELLARIAEFETRPQDTPDLPKFFDQMGLTEEEKTAVAKLDLSNGLHLPDLHEVPGVVSKFESALGKALEESGWSPSGNPSEYLKQGLYLSIDMPITLGSPGNGGENIETLSPDILAGGVVAMAAYINGKADNISTAKLPPILRELSLPSAVMGSISEYMAMHNIDNLANDPHVSSLMESIEAAMSEKLGDVLGADGWERSGLKFQKQDVTLQVSGKHVRIEKNGITELYSYLDTSASIEGAKELADTVVSANGSIDTILEFWHKGATSSDYSPKLMREFVDRQAALMGFDPIEWGVEVADNQYREVTGKLAVDGKVFATVQFGADAKAIVTDPAGNRVGSFTLRSNDYDTMMDRLEIVAKEAGLSAQSAASGNSPEVEKAVQTLQGIVDGSMSDAVSDDILASIEEAADVITAAGLEEQYDALIGDAVTVYTKQADTEAAA